MTAAIKSRGARMQADITALLRATNTLLWVVTREEQRVERALIQAAADAQFEVRFWDCAAGISDAAGRVVDAQSADPQRALATVRDGLPTEGAAPTGKAFARRVLVMRDLHRWLDPVTLRLVRNLARDLKAAPRAAKQAIVILTPSAEVPPELAGQAVVIDYPIPDRVEVAEILDDLVAGIPDEARRAAAAPNGVREAAIDAAVGLTAEEAEACYARSLVVAGRIDPGTVSAEKKRVIARERVLTWYDPDPRGLDAVGGLDLAKAWLRARASAFGARARAYGLPAPKGVLLVGIPGTGKSLLAKAVATAWGQPLLRLDVGALRSKYVGESEGNIRKALAVAETVSPCILWIDELEKALGGATGPQGDGGVSADALGAILSWMQERTSPVFVIATANDVSALPPELLRRGRFDEIFWIDLPTTTERAAVLATAVRAAGREPRAFDLAAVARGTPAFTGAELAAVIPDALYRAWADGEREPTTDDLAAAAAQVIPLARTAAERIDKMRAWAVGRARPASSPEAPDAQVAGGGRVLDM